MTNAWDETTVSSQHDSLKLLLRDLSGRCCNKSVSAGDPIGFSWSVVSMCANWFCSASAVLPCWKKQWMQNNWCLLKTLEMRSHQGQKKVSSVFLYTAQQWLCESWCTALETFGHLQLTWSSKTLEGGKTCAHFVSLWLIVFLNLKLILRVISSVFWGFD